jgi:hypothetical protein
MVLLSARLGFLLVIKQEASRAVRLSYLNSAAFGLQKRVDSIPHALGLYGEQGICRWISLRYACDMLDGGIDLCDFKSRDFEMIREYT